MSSPAYQCPLCRQPLKQHINSLVCDNKHCFDIAKESYVNLLPVQKKNSKTPGDNAEMLRARRDFLAQGYYQCLSNELTQQIKKLHQQPKTFIDIGCGEGYYLREIHLELNSAFLQGIDIAKPAIKLAAKQLPAAQFAVASAYDLPFLSNSFDCAISIFSPLHTNECLRILKSGAYFIHVEPGPDHLNELAAIIYRTPENHKGQGSDTDLHTLFTPISTQRIQTRIQVHQPHLDNLLYMTPYYWSCSEDKKKEISLLDKLTVTLDFKMSIYQKKLTLATYQETK